MAATSHLPRYGRSMTREERNPFGGFLFSEPDDALASLARAAKRDGLKLMPVDAGNGAIRLCLPSEQSFGAAGMALVNRAHGRSLLRLVGLVRRRSSAAGSECSFHPLPTA